MSRWKAKTDLYEAFDVYGWYKDYMVESWYESAKDVHGVTVYNRYRGEIFDVWYTFDNGQIDEVTENVNILTDDEWHDVKKALEEYYGI